MIELTNKRIITDNSEIKEMAARICQDYLHGAWKHVNVDNIGFKHISGGLSNLLYHISLPEALAEKEEAEPREVLLRVYGQTHGERALEALITESVIFTLLSERGLGPKLHGIFPGGRIEQYINARPLKTHELKDPKLSTQIAAKMAAIHTMEVPLHKLPNWLWDTIERWLKSCEKAKADIPEQFQHLNDVDVREEVDWLRERLLKENSPVVFCHNDMQEGNILMSQEHVEVEEEPKKLILIDFEYCSYNYRAFDIANHFVEWMYEYTEKEHPFYREMLDNYPSEEQRVRFVRAYLDEMGSKECLETVLREVRAFTLASHLFWFLWAMVNARTSQIPFGYWEYANSRLQAYLRAKNDLPPPPQGIKRKLHEVD